MTYASNQKTIYLPTHDENAGLRLSNNPFLINKKNHKEMCQ
jgi:hypothetical protein